MTRQPRFDVTIYQPNSAPLYEPGYEGPSGGAERQMYNLAHALAERGLRICHVVWSRPGLPRIHGGVALVTEPPTSPSHGQMRRALRIVRALRAGDARIYVQRSAGWEAIVLRGYTAMRRRRFVYSSANDLDFHYESIAPGIRSSGFYRAGLRWADGIVVQTSRQLGLARCVFPRIPYSAEIPSFAGIAPLPTRVPTSYLWAGRLVEYKEPLHYLNLAEALPFARFRMIAIETDQTPGDLASKVRSRANQLSNVELLPPTSHTHLLQLMEEAVAVVNTSRHEGMPNMFLEGWARGIPALTLQFDPDGQIARHGLGIAAAGSWETFVSGARRLWEMRHDRNKLALHTRGYISKTHEPKVVGARWADFLARVASDITE